MDVTECLRHRLARRCRALRTMVLVVLALLTPMSAAAQTLAAASGRVSFHVNTANHREAGQDSWTGTELWTGADLQSRESERPGIEFGVNFRHAGYPGADRPQRVSLYEGFVGIKFGDAQQMLVRGGHMWLPELGSIGALAGGLTEWRQSRRDKAPRFRAGAFAGVEPALYSAGYESDVRKYGGYVALEKGFRQRHLVGYTMIRHGPMIERSVVSLTNFVPVGTSFFLYQAAEIDVQGPADGTASPGVSYFLVNARQSWSRVELLGTYNRGRALDARTLTEEVQNGRLLTPRAIDGYRYESAGGRVTIEALSHVHVYAGYSRDRNNQQDDPSNRLTLGGHAADIFGSGFDVSASTDRLDRPAGPYHSTYVSIGRNVGRSLYVSGDYSTSLSVLRFADTDGVVIETRPSTTRISGNASANLLKNLSLLCTVDYTQDDAMDEIRVLAGVSVRLR